MLKIPLASFNSGISPSTNLVGTGALLRTHRPLTRCLKAFERIFSNTRKVRANRNAALHRVPSKPKKLNGMMAAGVLDYSNIIKRIS